MKYLHRKLLALRMKLARWTQNWEHYYRIAIQLEALTPRRDKWDWYWKIPREASLEIYRRYHTLSWDQKDEFWRNSKP